MNQPVSLGILGSTRGTGMQALIEAKANIKIVISNKENAGILLRAEQAQLETRFIDPIGISKEEFDKKISHLLQTYSVELVVLIGYMRILSKEFINTWRNKIINVHPSLLPDFAGKMDQQVHEAVLQAKVKETGCTVHVVTEEVDAGPILLQKKCPVLPDDTVATLKSRVQELENEALLEVINNWRKINE